LNEHRPKMSFKHTTLFAALRTVYCLIQKMLSLTSNETQVVISLNICLVIEFTHIDSTCSN
jgi:uncharacterized membrane protein (DUF441 family)